MNIGKIKFIKLGSKKDNIEKDCIEKGQLVLGYQGISHFKNYENLVIEDLRNEIIDIYKSDKGSATRHAKQIISFYDNTDTTLWITFSQRKVWWAFTDNNKVPYKEGEGNFTYRDTKEGWISKDKENRELTFDNISGALLKTQGFQGTICEISKKDSFPIKKYTRLLIEGKKFPELIKAEKRKKDIVASMADLVKMLHPKDFEYIVDLIFQYSGWKKVTPGAGVEEFLDLDLLMPLTNQRIAVQIKSTTNQSQYEEYEKKFLELDTYKEFYYVYHTSENKIKISNEIKNVTIITIDKISELIVELGLISILMKKVGS